MDNQELVDDDQLLMELEQMKANEKGQPGAVIPAEEMKFDDGKSKGALISLFRSRSNQRRCQKSATSPNQEVKLNVTQPSLSSYKSKCTLATSCLGNMLEYKFRNLKKGHLTCNSFKSFNV